MTFKRLLLRPAWGAHKARGSILMSARCSVQLRVAHCAPQLLSKARVSHARFEEPDFPEPCDCFALMTELSLHHPFSGLAISPPDNQPDTGSDTRKKQSPAVGKRKHCQQHKQQR